MYEEWDVFEFKIKDRCQWDCFGFGVYGCGSC